MLNNLFKSFFSKKLITKDKSIKTKLFISTMLMLATSSGVMTAYADELHSVRVVIDGEWHSYTTKDETVEQFFEDNNIVLHEKDIVDTPLDKVITKEIFININRAETVKFIINGKDKINFTTNEPKLGVAVELFEDKQGQKYQLEEGQSSATIVTNGLEVKVTSYNEVKKTITESILFETEEVQNPNMLAGEQNIKVKGINGSEEIIIKETYKDETLIGTDIVSKNISVQPVSQVIEVGTKVVKQPTNTIKTEKGTFTFTDKIKMKSTAYTAGKESTGKSPGDAGYGITASGRKAQHGVVAVDTSHIPFGTKLYIEGYGYAVAGDTGGAIKGHKIDVFFDKLSDAINYGVRTINVYILDELV